MIEQFHGKIALILERILTEITLGSLVAAVEKNKNSHSAQEKKDFTEQKSNEFRCKVRHNFQERVPFGHP